MNVDPAVEPLVEAPALIVVIRPRMPRHKPESLPTREFGHRKQIQSRMI
jgi:hypothetical protein